MTHTHTHTHAYAHTHNDTRARTHAHTYIHTHTHTHTHSYTLNKGAEYEVFLKTALSDNGSFWAELSLRDSTCDKLMKELKQRLSTTRTKNITLFNIGNFSAVGFHESWSRAKIITANGCMVGLTFYFGTSPSQCWISFETSSLM